MAKVNPEDLEDREFLQDLRDAAEEMAKKLPSRVWTRAYQRLASAADCLDAMEVRTIDNGD